MLSKYENYTGQIHVNARGTQTFEKSLWQPKPGHMIVKVVFDFYRDLPQSKEDALCKSDIEFVGAGESATQLLNLLQEIEFPSRDTIEMLAIDGLKISRGYNRVAAVLATNTGDPLKLQLRIKGRNYRELGGIKK